jgi:virginiamycin B lyase
MKKIHIQRVGSTWGTDSTRCGAHELREERPYIVGARGGCRAGGGGLALARPFPARSDSSYLNGIALLAFIILCLTFFLTACNSANPPATSTSSSSSDRHTTTTPAAPGHFQEFALPQGDDGLMRPAVDHEGRVWFGEMNRNYLANFDPRTKTFQQITPPHGKYGVMGVEVAKDDTVWFAEQLANYIGHYFPTSGQFRTYDLPWLKEPDPSNANKTLTLPSAPNDLAIDSQDNIWFTEQNADAIGEIIPGTNTIRQFALSPSHSFGQLTPYGITTDPQGNVWFTETSNNRVGRLDPRTGSITSFSKAGLTTGLMEIASDQHGTIWITSFNNNLLLSLNPHTGTFTPYYAPHSGNTTGGLYGLTISTDGNVWITISSDNTIARLDPSTGHFLTYTVPTPNSLPLGIAEGTNHIFWFTEASSNKIGMLNS